MFQCYINDICVLGNSGFLDSKPHRKAAASEGWLQKAAEEADLIVDGEDDSDEEFYQVFVVCSCTNVK